MPGRLACPARYDRRMAYDEDLAARIRDLIGPDPELTEKKMFGGLALSSSRGHMAISASGQGGVLVHVDSGRYAGLLAASGATTAVMQGREMPGWLRVEPGRPWPATTTFPGGWKSASGTHGRCRRSSPRRQS